MEAYRDARGTTVGPVGLADELVPEADEDLVAVSLFVEDTAPEALDESAALA